MISPVAIGAFDRAQAAAGMPAASETTLKLTYLVQLRSWLPVQPDVQLVIHLGATRASRDALVPGLRIALFPLTRHPRP